MHAPWSSCTRARCSSGRAHAPGAAAGRVCPLPSPAAAPARPPASRPGPAERGPRTRERNGMSAAAQGRKASGAPSPRQALTLAARPRSRLATASRRRSLSCWTEGVVGARLLLVPGSVAVGAAALGAGSRWLLRRLELAVHAAAVGGPVHASGEVARVRWATPACTACPRSDPARRLVQLQK